ncbi:hypothetical protein K4K61_008251 [Colletotrichum sp. SAR11_59]|nr:hypothetical protein K4K61_008251 [Colletotrichum sp. SAR11_59]
MAYNLGGMDEYDPKAPQPPVAGQIKLMKVSFAGNYFYDTGIYIPKLAMLAFYFKLIPKTMPLLRKALYGVIFAIPFPLLHGLQLSRRYIIGLIATFSTGIITIGASVGRFATVESIKAWTNVYVLSMTEVSAAILVVSLPALKSLLHRRGLSTSKYGTAQSGSAGLGYSKHPTANTHIKLSSGRDPYMATTRVAAENESGSEVELNTLKRSDVIYKSERVSVTYQRREDGEGDKAKPGPRY